MHDIVIGIPTYRRPEQLTNLLETLVPEVVSCPAIIVVADNACSPATETIIAAFAFRIPSIVSIPVPERGLAAVRNALVNHATSACPKWRWLAMLDDDGLATPGWLSTIVACAERYGADLVGGPVQGVLPAHSNRLARNSIFAQRTRRNTGLVTTLNTTQNLLISRKLVDKLPGPLFNAAYGASGGEDYELFRRTAKNNGRIAWCDEAIVMEPTPAERLTPRRILLRYYSTGQYMARIDSSFDGWLNTGFHSAKGLAGALLRLIRDYLLRFDRDAGSRGVLAVSHYFGRIAGLVGSRSLRYAGTKGRR